MERFINRFWGDEDGNVTIDWIVLTAGIVMLGAAVMVAVGPTTQDLADGTTDKINAIQMGI